MSKSSEPKVDPMFDQPQGVYRKDGVRLKVTRDGAVTDQPVTPIPPKPPQPRP